jgi:hypothetical protein
MELIKINYCVMPVPDQVRDDESGIQNTYPHLSWIPAFAGMTSRSATMENLLRLKARGFNHPRKGH